MTRECNHGLRIPVKPFVTHGYVTMGYAFGMARDRSDLRWQHIADPRLAWMRLGWARQTHGKYSSAESFAAAIKENGHNYRAHERDPDAPSKHIDLDFDKAVAWADALDVRWQWLLRGEGAPWRDETPAFSPEATSIAELVDRLPEDQRKAKADAIKALLTGS